MLMVPTVILLNGLLGAICGLWFRVQIFIPLVAVACVEVAVLRQTGVWTSVIWSAVALIISMEVGYLIGSALTVLGAYFKLPTLSSRLEARRDRRLSHS